MQIIKLDATDSTNTYLKNLHRQKHLQDFTIVVADKQSKGKGQMGAKWESEPFKNLTFSTLKNFDTLSVVNSFSLNICASLAVSNALKRFSIPDLYVKWPNDILSGTMKICGILIENVLIGTQIKTSIIGLGLNVNQTKFRTVSNATSMKLLLGRTFNLDVIRDVIIDELKTLLLLLENQEFGVLRKQYGQQLFRKDKPSSFKNMEGAIFMGFIREVSPEGKLLVELEDMVIKEFDLKQIKLLY